ncbi:Uma2 family endonuclease [soil metagenome]
MASTAGSDLRDHVGPWTEDDFLALDEDRSVELLDGSLLVSPLANRGHQRLSSRLWSALDDAAPEGVEVLKAINVRVPPGRILGPNLVVVTKPGGDLTVTESADVALVVEITSRGNIAADRAIKPPLYAQAGVPHYLRIELHQGRPTALVFALRGGSYVEVDRAPPGELLRLTTSIAVTLDLAALAEVSRSAR